MTKLLLASAASLALAACAGPGAEPPPGASGRCPIASSEGWRAYINAMPGPDAPRLVVTGRVTAPTGGWRLSLERGALREIDPPHQEVILRAEPPSGMASQAIVTEEVTGTWRALPRYGRVIVRCGEEVLAEITDIGTAH